MHQKKHKIKIIDFFCIGFGAIIGVGWAVAINGWMVNCGGPIPAAIGYLLCLFLTIPLGLCYCELVSMMPVAGGSMAFSYRAFNKTASFISGWASYGAFIAILPWEAIQITDILGYLFPGLKAGRPLYSIMGSDVYLTSILIGLLFSFLLYILNRNGFSSAATFQRFLCLFLVGTAVLGVVASLIGGNMKNLKPFYDTSDPTIYGEGLKQVSHHSLFGGALAIVAQAAFFLAGFETIPQSVEEAGGSIKNVGKMVVLSVGSACVFYAVLLVCFGYAWPWKQFAVMEHPAASVLFTFLFPGRIGNTLYWIITLGAVAGLLTSWNGFFTPSSNLLMSMGRARFLPEIFAVQDKNGVAIHAQKIAFLLSAIGPFLGANLIDAITCFSSAAFVLSWFLTAFSLVRLRIKEPKANRPYRIPGGMFIGIFAALVSAAVLIFMFLPNSPFFIGKLTIAMFAIWMLFGFALYASNKRERCLITEKEVNESIFKNTTQIELRTPEKP